MSAELNRDEPATSKPRGRRAFVALGILFAIVLGGIVGYGYFTANRESTDDAVVEADVVAVTSRVGGVVAQLMVHDNQMVKKGEVVLQLDDADLQARLAQARADLQTAQAQAAGAHAQEHVIEATARGGLKSAEASMSATASTVQGA